MRPAPGSILKIPLRLRNLSLLKTSYYKKKIAGTSFDTVASRGKFRLLHFKAESQVIPSQKRIPLLIIPSLINRYTILDLYSGCSVVENLVDEGHDVYLLDWGTPRVQDKYLSLDDHIDLGLKWALKKVKNLAQKEKVHLLGQCLGGTLSAVVASQCPESVESLILLTTPIDFHVEGPFYHWVHKSNLNLDQMVSTWGNVHAEFLDRSFQMITPMASLKQKKVLWDLGWSESFMKKHVAITEWVKDSVPFPGLAYKELIENYYVLNDLKLEKIKVPLISFLAKGDIIVPNASSQAIKSYSDQYNEVFLSGGHIGCVVGEKGHAKLCQELIKWLEFVC